MGNESEIERRLEILEATAFGRYGTFWHQTGKLEDGMMWGEVGSLRHLIDPVTKRPISKGYHEIKILFPRRRYLGMVGAHEEEFEVDFRVEVSAHATIR